jgi:hypothetical protein
MFFFSSLALKTYNQWIIQFIKLIHGTPLYSHPSAEFKDPINDELYILLQLTQWALPKEVLQHNLLIQPEQLSAPDAFDNVK